MEEEGNAKDPDKSSNEQLGKIDLARPGKNETIAHDNQTDTDKDENPAGEIVRLTEAVKRPIKRAFACLFKHNAVVTVISTVAIAASTIAYAILTAFYVHYSRAQWKVMRDQLDAANASIRTSQQSYVTVGRQDGTVAEIVWPKNPEGKAGILVYFRNNGHLPAKFNWGTENEIIAVLPNDPNIPVGAPGASSSGGYEVRTNNVFKPMWRARNRKTGNFMASQVTMIGGDSLYAGNLWEVPKERMVQMQNSALWTVGTFEYCDAFHNYVCRNFALIYRREPYNRFMVVSEEECLGAENAIIHPDPDLEFLSPCATGTEREETRIFQGIKGWVYPGH